MTITEDKIAVLRAVRRGAAAPQEVSAATRLPIERVMAAAALLRGDGEYPDLLCALDGEPGAVTANGAQILEALA